VKTSPSLWAVWAGGEGRVDPVDVWNMRTPFFAGGRVDEIFLQ
jgi:hypothetical protein